jgi:heat shock protein HslJ
MTLVTDYGASRVVVPRPAARPVAGGHVLDAEAHGIGVRVENGICRDTMTGQPFPDSVTVTASGRDLAGCGGDPFALLAGATWVVRGITHAGTVAEIAPDRPPTLAFGPDGRLTGSSGCNGYSGRYEISPERLDVGHVASTRRACEPTLMQQEAAFFDALAGTAEYALGADGTLVLRGAGQEIVAARP